MIRTYQYCLLPRRGEKKLLEYLLAMSCNVYNKALERRVETYKETGSGITYGMQWPHFRELRHLDPSGIGMLNAGCMQQTLRRLDKAFKAFFRRVKAGEEPGYPRFKSRNRWKSIEFTHGDGCKLRFDADGRALLYIMNVGEIKIKYHREIPSGAKIKHVIIKRNLGKWHVFFQVEMPEQEIVTHCGPEIGIDVGIKSLLALSDGTLIDNPRWLRESLGDLRIAQRRVSRRKRGSSRRRKAALQVAKIHDHIANQRHDFWHKTTRKLADTYSFIAIEDLNLTFMTRNHHLALSASDAGLGIFRQLLTYKVEETGSSLVAVNPTYTSAMCSGCNEIVKKDLSIRTHKCPYCGLVLGRDVNAAINILQSARTGRSCANVARSKGERSTRSSLL